MCFGSLRSSYFSRCGGFGGGFCGGLGGGGCSCNRVLALDGAGEGAGAGAGFLRDLTSSNSMGSGSLTIALTLSLMPRSRARPVASNGQRDHPASWRVRHAHAERLPSALSAHPSPSVPQRTTLHAREHAACRRVPDRTPTNRADLCLDDPHHTRTGQELMAALNGGARSAAVAEGVTALWLQHEQPARLLPWLDTAACQYSRHNRIRAETRRNPPCLRSRR